MFIQLKNKIAALVQRALSIDSVQQRLDQLLEETNNNRRQIESAETRINQLSQKLSQLVSAATVEAQTLIENQRSAIEERIRRVEEQLARSNYYDELKEVWLPEGISTHSEPEYYLAAFLYNFLSNRVALDVGANEGQFAEIAASTGFEVYCFEPYSPTFQRLRDRLAGQKNVTFFNLALGSKIEKRPLYVASTSRDRDAEQPALEQPSLYHTFRPHFVTESLEFSEKVDVEVQTIDSLARAGQIPESIGFLKIDTEGFDLEVVKGIGSIRPEVVETEFWGDEFLFVRSAQTQRENVTTPADLISQLRAMNYFWNLIVFRIEGELSVRFATNLANAPKNAWGNILFFRQHTLFLNAYHWCESCLPRFQAPPIAG